MFKPEELVVFMTLPRGVDESIIPGVLASRGIPACRSDIWRTWGDLSRFKFPLRVLKMLDEHSTTQNVLENR